MNSILERISKTTNIKEQMKNNNSFVILAIIFIVSAVAIPGFIKGSNLLNILVDSSIYGIMGVGMSFVLLLGAFDLSLGNQLSLATILTVYGAEYGMFTAIIFPILGCIVVGILNGLIISKLNVNAFIGTLGTMISLKGFLLLITNGETQISLNDGLASIFNSKFLSIPVPIWICLAILCVMQFILSKTKFGFNIYVLGGNREAAQYAGIKIWMIEVACFVIVSLMCAIAGILTASRLNIGSPIVGDTITLNIVAACIIGGIWMSGGVGNMYKTICGVIIMQVVSNIMYILGLYSYLQNLITGLIIIVVLILDKVTHDTGNSGN